MTHHDKLYGLLFYDYFDKMFSLPILVSYCKLAATPLEASSGTLNVFFI